MNEYQRKYSNARKLLPKPRKNNLSVRFEVRKANLVGAKKNFDYQAGRLDLSQFVVASLNRLWSLRRRLRVAFSARQLLGTSGG